MRVFTAPPPAVPELLRAAVARRRNGNRIPLAPHSCVAALAASVFACLEPSRDRVRRVSRSPARPMLRSLPPFHLCDLLSSPLCFIAWRHLRVLQAAFGVQSSVVSGRGSVLYRSSLSFCSAGLLRETCTRSSERERLHRHFLALFLRLPRFFAPLARNNEKAQSPN